MKYLVQSKGFTTDYDTQKREKDLENAKKVVVLWQLLIKIINSILSKLIEQKSHRDYKRTQQGVHSVFLHYIYY